MKKALYLICLLGFQGLTAQIDTIPKEVINDN